MFTGYTCSFLFFIFILSGPWPAASFSAEKVVKQVNFMDRIEEIQERFP